MGSLLKQKGGSFEAFLEGRVVHEQDSNPTGKHPDLNAHRRTEVGAK